LRVCSSWQTSQNKKHPDRVSPLIRESSKLTKLGRKPDRSGSRDRADPAYIIAINNKLFIYEASTFDTALSRILIEDLVARPQTAWILSSRNENPGLCWHYVLYKYNAQVALPIFMNAHIA
jgi:hypothetical protein